MPADTTKSSSRRPQRKVTEEELKNIELQRIRGELSCAECRRLKLRCDKKVPCSSCCRRGCESICPCGILSAGQGTRFILADTDQLHRKIADMSHRIRQLEDALAILQAAISPERHPLLQDDLLKVKFGPEAPEGRKIALPEEDKTTKQSIDAFGTLTLGDSGEVKYFGRSAGSETLMMAEEDRESSEDDEDEESRIELTPELSNIANLFPFTSKRRSNVNSLEALEALLPPHERAWTLSDCYLTHAAYFFRPIKRDELTTSLIPAVYKTASRRVSSRVAADASPGIDPSSGSGPIDVHSPHALATLFFVFALGALLDLSLPPYNAEAEHYYDLGRAALSLRAVFDSPQVDTVQALGLMATYHSLAGKKYSRDSAWCIMSLVAKLVQSIGLHRDSARWHMDPMMVQKRRTLFWEVFSADVSHSLALGRPPAIHLTYVDCEFPEDEEATLSNAGEVQNGFWRMKYTFAREMFFAVAEATLIAKSPSYTTVLNLDRKVREISFPMSFKPYVLREDGEQEYFSSSLSLQGFYASQHRTVTMLYLHRSFFAQAMLDHPTNPLRSPFAPSFLTAYRCASVIIKASAHQFDRCAEMAMRVWFLMYHTFSAAVIVGTVVTRSPNSSIASSALVDLTKAIELFERTALQSQRAKIALGVLLKLKEKAVQSYDQYCASLPTQPDKSITNVPLSFDYESKVDIDDQLSIFGGQTRVLSRKSRIKNSPSAWGAMSPSPSLDSSLINLQTAIDLDSTASMMWTSDVHPSLLEYLGPASSFPKRNTVFPPQPSSTIDSMGLAMPESTILTLAHTVDPSVIYPPSLREPGELSSNLFNYSGNLPDNGTNTIPNGLPSLISTSNLTTSQVSSPLKWDEGSDSGLPRADDSFGWVPPPHRLNFVQQISHKDPVDETNAFYNPSHQQSHRQGTHPGTVTLYPPNQILLSGLQAGRTGQANDIATPVAPAGAMVELGLSTESDIDSGWLSFMHDCGIMDTENTSG